MGPWARLLRRPKRHFGMRILANRSEVYDYSLVVLWCSPSHHSCNAGTAEKQLIILPRPVIMVESS